MIDKRLFEDLNKELTGRFCSDSLHRSLYATDASVYRKIPLGVAYPATEADLRKIVLFASKHKVSLTPRAAGTSLAGQCVGTGIIVDTSKHFCKILHFDSAAKTVTVQPGVVRDDLNRFLEPHGLFFGPNTSTSNRCTIGGMVGNNSSGTTSIQYGVTRDKVRRLKTVLSDGSVGVFEELSTREFLKKCQDNALEGAIYQTLHTELSKPEVQNEILRSFPHASIHRRNTGYAVDALLDSDLFGGSHPKINLCSLLCGSEGTLGITTEITLQLDDLPPKHRVMVPVHFKSIQESLKAVIVAMKHPLFTCELMDRIILDCTKNNRSQRENRFFLKGDPEALLLLEVAAECSESASALADALIEDLQAANFGYHHPKIFDAEIDKIHHLRKAGLGLLGNLIGDKKAVACIEDTAVRLMDLPEYIDAFTQMMTDYKQEAVYYAHAGAGEIHLRPILNLKKKADVDLFREITHKTAKLVKKYGGSFSGEHGDGIVRSEFIPLMVGDQNMALLRKIKAVFDSKNLFNPGKIVHADRMDEHLRYRAERQEPKISTLMNFEDNQGVLRFAEKCNGSGDCRKPVASGGTMCPSYRATLEEKDSTRARANALREFLTTSSKKNKFDHEELRAVFDLCIGCKACASECPSSVDVAVMKAEFLHQYHQKNTRSFRDYLLGNNAAFNRWASLFPKVSNRILRASTTKKMLGIAPERKLPTLAKTTLRKWYRKNKNRLHNGNHFHGTVYVFCDAFTNYYDLQTGIDCLELLHAIGYKPLVVAHPDSGRSLISKGLLSKAKRKANTNIAIFHDLVSEAIPLIGIEPSAILTFRDEYLRLAEDKKKAKYVAKHCHTVEEFLKRAMDENKLRSEQFTKSEKTIKIHGHCHQKVLSNMEATFQILNLPVNYRVSLLSSGCCGMAGSFGYEKEHFAVSVKIGEDTLMPKLRRLSAETIVAASGTSCRHQISDLVTRKSLHPIRILRAAMRVT